MTKAPVNYIDLANNENDFLNIIKQNEKLIDDLEQKENENILLKAQYKKTIDNEKQKVIEYRNKMIEMRDNFDQKRNQFMQELLEKDEEIVKLMTNVRKLNTKNHTKSVINIKKHRRSATPSDDLVNIQARLSNLGDTNSNAPPPMPPFNATMKAKRSKPIEVESSSVAEYKRLRNKHRLGDSTNRTQYTKLMPTTFDEANSNEVIAENNDNDFTTSLDEEVSSVSHINGNFISSKSSRIDLDKSIPRPQSMNRKEFVFGRGNNLKINSSRIGYSNFNNKSMIMSMSRPF